jgi:uncharacterized OsmC-like protein
MTAIDGDDTLGSANERVDAWWLGPDAPDLNAMADFPERLRGQTVTMSAVMRTLKLDGQLKSARYRHFEFFSDEPPFIGGDDEYPQPLTYLVAGIGFCLLTQIQRIAAMKKRTITRADCRVEFDIAQSGSVLRGDAHAEARGVRIHVVVDSPESPADIAEVLRLAEQTCFAEALVRAPVRLDHQYTINGSAFGAEEMQ